MLKKGVTLNRMSRNQKVDSREEDVIKEPILLNRVVLKNKPTYVYVYWKVMLCVSFTFLPNIIVGTLGGTLFSFSSPIHV